MVENIYLIIIVVLAFYLRSITYDYLIDDQLVPKRTGKNFLHTFWLQLSANGYSNLPLEHLQRIFIHCFVSCMIYLAFGMTDVSLAAALLYAVNPVNINSVAWLNGVGYSMSALLVIGMMMSGNILITCGLFIFTLWWHVTAFPAFMMLLFSGTPQLALCIYPYVLLVAWSHVNVPFCKSQDNATFSRRWDSAIGNYKRIFPRKFIFMIKTYAYYFLMTLAPLRLGLFHSFALEVFITDDSTEKWLRPTPLFWTGVMLLLGSGAIIVSAWGTPVAYGLLWFAVFILPFCNLIVIHQPISERYCYLPGIGLMYALAGAVDAIFQPGPGLAVLAAIWGGYAVKNIIHLSGYRNMDKYLDYSLFDHPDCFGLWNYKGVIEAERGRIFTAMYFYANALKFYPNSFRVNYNLAQLFRRLGMKEAAEKYMADAGKGLSPEEVERSIAATNRDDAAMRRRVGIVEGMVRGRVKS